MSYILTTGAVMLINVAGVLCVTGLIFLYEKLISRKF